MTRKRSFLPPDSASSALLLAPVVAAMRLPRMVAEAGDVGKWASETTLAVTEKVEAAAEGTLAAQMSLFSSAAAFWPEVLAGRMPSLMTGEAVERSLSAALAPTSRRVRDNYRRLSKP